MTQATQTNAQGFTTKRWAVTLDDGTKRVTWAPTKAEAADKLGQPAKCAEPIGMDWRCASRKGTQLEQINIRVSAEQRAIMLRRASTAGCSLTEYILRRCT